MDSRSRLDYALFQLTPTRTRCDLVICAGDCKEKLASGLLEPFISHLKFAKDQISKGGYSVTLSASASWFTKSTLERFVRFVSTPEVLERFITIEREIANIDCSINTNASSDSQTVYGFEEHLNKSTNSAYKHEQNTSDAVHEEDPKVHLQRVLETRKAVLQKEQAMVYARALVAGFETDNLEDLICFADAFGSPRLREACSNFMGLCNTKSNDRVWMDEVAAMQAYSRSQNSNMGAIDGIVLPDDTDPSQELRINVRNGNFDHAASDSSISHESQYMHSYQNGPMFPPPYQGYPFHGMAIPPYYQGNLSWPPNVENFRSRGKHSKKKVSRGLKQDSNLESSDSSSGSEPSRSPSRKVVIRNINYITSVKDGEEESESTDNSSSGGVNQDLDRTVKEKREGQNVRKQWNIFQNLLMKDADDRESEEVKKPHNSFSDPHLLPREDRSPIIQNYSKYEHEFVSHKFEEQNINPSGLKPEFGTKSSTIGRHQDGDWLSGILPDKAIQEKSRDIFEDRFYSAESMKNVLVDDPLEVQARLLSEPSDSQLRTQDILMVPKAPSPYKKVPDACINEPNDLYMLPERDAASQQDITTWTPEMESGNSNSKSVKLDSAQDKRSHLLGKENKSRPKPLVGRSLERKGSTIEAKSKASVGSLGKTKSDIISRSKKSTGTKTTIPKGISPKEEERRKKMEELLTQRQKRIAERSASTTKIDGPKAQLASRDMKKSNKPVIRSSTIDRLSAARVVNPKVLPTKSKPGSKPTKVITKENGQSKPGQKPTKVTTKENGRSKPGHKPTKVTTKENDQSKPGKKPTKVTTKENDQSKPGKKPTKVTTKENGVSRASFSQRTAGVEKKVVKPDKVKHPDKTVGSKNPNKKIADLNKKLPKEASPIKKSDNGVAQNRLSAPPNHQSSQSDNKKGVNETLSANKALNTVSFRINEDNGSKRNLSVKANHEILLTETSAPPLGKGSNPRMKWSNVGASAKALSGFRKLLSFGRRIN